MLFTRRGDRNDASKPGHAGRKERLSVTREGFGYIGMWIILVAVGLYHQLNLVMLVAGMAAGPFLASWILSANMIRKLKPRRRTPPFVFAGDPLAIEYTVENARRGDASAIVIRDRLDPVDSTIPGAASIAIELFFARIPGRSAEWLRFSSTPPARGKYRLKSMELLTRRPFGLIERRVRLADPGELVVYPSVGRLKRRWRLLQKESTQTRRGPRHDRSNQQQEYHGLRDYRPDDSPRWVHWRTSARLGRLMVKEFEQQHDQDLVLLLDPWLPKSHVGGEHREAVETLIRFAATVCLETCRSQGRRIVLGWTGAAAGMKQGPASVKLLHGLLERLATLRGSSLGQLSALFDMLPPPTIRDSMMIVVSTRPVNLVEESERSSRLIGAAGRSVLARIRVLDVSHGGLKAYFEDDPDSASMNSDMWVDQSEKRRRDDEIPEIDPLDSVSATIDPDRAVAAGGSSATDRSSDGRGAATP